MDNNKSIFGIEVFSKQKHTDELDGKDNKMTSQFDQKKHKNGSNEGEHELPEKLVKPNHLKSESIKPHKNDSENYVINHNKITFDGATMTKKKSPTKKTLFNLQNNANAQILSQNCIICLQMSYVEVLKQNEKSKQIKNGLNRKSEIIKDLTRKLEETQSQTQRVLDENKDKNKRLINHIKVVEQDLRVLNKKYDDSKNEILRLKNFLSEFSEDVDMKMNSTCKSVGNKQSDVYLEQTCKILDLKKEDLSLFFMTEKSAVKSKTIKKRNVKTKTENEEQLDLESFVADFKDKIDKLIK